MNHRQLRLALGVFFIAMGVAVLVLRFGFPDVAVRFGRPLNMAIGGVFALVMGALNIARWYVAHMHFQRRATPVRTPLQPEREVRAPAEYNPDFDFDRSKANG
jgi:hypothetical protein